MATASQIFDPNSAEDSAKAFLMFVETGDIAMMKLELKSNPSLANTKDKHGTPALHLAVQEANTDMIDLLLEKGADPRTPDEHGVTADRLALQLGLDSAAAEIKRLAVRLDMPDKSSNLRREFENVIQGFAKGGEKPIAAPERATFKQKRRDSVNLSPVAPA